MASESLLPKVSSRVCTEVEIQFDGGPGNEAYQGAAADAAKHRDHLHGAVQARVSPTGVRVARVRPRPLAAGLGKACSGPVHEKCLDFVPKVSAEHEQAGKKHHVTRHREDQRVGGESWK